MAKKADIEDYSLIIRLNNSDQRSFSRLYEKYSGMVYSYVLSVFHDDYLAEEITQQCFVMLWNKRTSISPTGNLPAYLYVSARNAVLKETRRQLRAARFMESMASSLDSPSREMSSGEVDSNLIFREIGKIVSSLPKSRKEIFILKNIKGLSVKEIAEKLNISPKTVETQLGRASRTIRIRLSQVLFMLIIYIYNKPFNFF